ncbi:MAG: MGMT family protein [Saprospiraceae bacterium]|nr:MGMT family protein [Saprospiraceae bacterium]
MSYHDDVYAVTKKIPFGRITTYGAIANYLALGSARMVGWALNRSFATENVPAHRVVNRKGELTGRTHFPSPTLMSQLLENEGVEIEDNTVQNFQTHFWDPAEELGSIS